MMRLSSRPQDITISSACSRFATDYQDYGDAPRKPKERRKGIGGQKDPQSGCLSRVPRESLFCST